MLLCVVWQSWRWWGFWGDVQEDVGIGGVLSLLWFRRRLPDYATKFIEMVCTALVVVHRVGIIVTSHVVVLCCVVADLDGGR